MPSGFEGWISLFDDDAYDGTAFSNPQALFADKETLSFGKEIQHRPKTISNSRSAFAEELVYGPSKPEGAVTYQFRSDDILKPLFSHFQLGTMEATAVPYRYSFYPLKNTLDWNNQGTNIQGSYGSYGGKPYTISVLKKTWDTSSNGGTNAFFFKHGIVNKLTFSCLANDDAKVTAEFKFRDLDKGTAVPYNPNSAEVGSYSSFPSFCSYTANVTLNGQAFEISGFQVESTQNTQENSRLGRQAPENYQFSSPSVKGFFTLDLPDDAHSHIDGMFSAAGFGFVATFYNGTNDRVVIDLPYCRRMPFDFQNSGGDSPWRTQIPFEAFESFGQYPIKVTVDTDYQFNPSFFFGDAGLGARGVFPLYDAGTETRDLSAYLLYSHH